MSLCVSGRSCSSRDAAGCAGLRRRWCGTSGDEVYEGRTKRNSPRAGLGDTSVTLADGALGSGIGKASGDLGLGAVDLGVLASAVIGRGEMDLRRRKSSSWGFRSRQTWRWVDGGVCGCGKFVMYEERLVAIVRWEEQAAVSVSYSLAAT